MQYAMKSKNMTLLNPYLFYDLIINEDLGNLFGKGPINTDNRPFLEFSAPKIIYRHKEFSSAGYKDILGHLQMRRWLQPETDKIIQAINSDFDAQLDRLNFYLPHVIPLNLSTATPGQISRYAGILSSFCSNNLVENFPFVNDPDLLRMCIATQILAMKNKLDTVGNKYGLLCHLANLHHLSKMPREAIHYYVQAIQADPTRDKAFFKLGNVYAEQGLYDQAIEMYRKAIDINPRNAEVFYNLGLQLARQKKFTEAETNLRRSLAMDPGIIPAHYVLGNVLIDLGKTVEGNQHLEEAARLERENK
jgi:tetratricopeptide (TPR) repeat protein